MTSKEALENIKDNYPLVHPTNYKLIKESYDTLEKLAESYDTLEKLAERDTPKKAIKHKPFYFIYDVCPNCKTELNEYYKFCKECGQRIDWSE